MSGLGKYHKHDALSLQGPCSNMMLHPEPPLRHRHDAIDMTAPYMLLKDANFWFAGHVNM